MGLMLKLDIVNFLNGMIRFESLGFWFGKIINVFCFKTKEKVTI